MLRLLANVFLLISTFIINSTLFETIKLYGIKPDLFIIIIVSTAVLRNDIEGALLGFFMGLVRDIFFGNLIGFFALFYMLTGYFCGKPFKYFYRENYFIPMILCFLATVFFESFTFFFSLFPSQNIFYVLAKIIFPKAIYNTVLIFITYPLIYFVNKKLERKEISKHNFF